MAGTDLPNRPAPQQFPFLAGGGEMGGRTRAKDWSQSPVGAIATWPQSLRTAVSICLGSRHPIVLWWGKDHLTQFYNDAFISFLGHAKHPGALGQSASDCWREIWQIMAPMLASVFTTAEATWSEDFLYVLDRKLPREEGYFTFSYSPIRDDAGAAGGVFCACKETTDRVIGERRLRTLRDLGQTQAEAKTAESACETAAHILGENPADVPFALIYLLDDAATCARLTATSALLPGDRAAPREIDFTAGSGSAIAPVWPLARALATGTSEDVSDLFMRLGSLPGGPWPEPPTVARIIPIAASGKAVPIGFLVAGSSPRLVWDAEYAGFLDLVAGHVGASIANARAYEEERRRVEALTEIDRAKTAFFSNVSHEFRTPLTLLLGPLEEALARPAEDGERRELIDTAHRNALRLLKLVDTLLDFSRIEAGRVEASYEPVDLAALTAEIASNFRSACDRAGLYLRVYCPRLDEPVYVDRGMWEKIVLNLLSNAFKFTFDGGITVRIGVADGRVALSVRDTGVGIPQHELPRVFERFHRIEGQKSRTYEGSGIGLALVQELVKFHGGTISADSTPGQGTSFLIGIPFGSAHLPPDRIRTAAPSRAPAGGAGAFVEEALHWLPDASDAPEISVTGGVTAPARGTRILLADDNADMRGYIRRLLGGYCTVEAVADGEAALGAIRSERPDLVLADIMMPRLDGFGLIRAIRSDPALRDLPVMLLSARAGEEARVEGLEAGADDYLVKPFSARELTVRIFTRLDLVRVRREAAQAVRASEERLRAVFDGTYECVGLLSSDGTLIEANRASLEFAGNRREDIIGRPLWDAVWFTHTPKAGEQLRRAIALAAAGRFIRFEAALKRPFGGVVTFDFSLHPVRGEDRKVVLIVAEARDISQRKQAEDGLRELNETLERNVERRTQALAAEVAERQKTEAALQQALRLEAIGYLTGGIAHDFNNLLTVVSGHIDAILTAAQNPRVAQMAAAIERAVDRGARLTRQLLAFARRQQLQPAIVDFGRMMAEIDALIRRAAGETVTVQLDAAPDLWPVLVDPAQFESALLNLTMNARDAMPEGGRLTFSASNAAVTGVAADRLGISPGDYVVVGVTDTGTGMPPGVTAHAFEPFFTTKDVDRGTGLGLSQIYGFVKQSKGTATIESTLGAGTTVSLYLPRGETRYVGEATASEAAPLHHGRGKTVLIVEDQPQVRDVIKMLLDELGYEILTAPDGVEAENILGSEQPIDLLLTDIVMPNGISGLELAQRARRRHPDLKIVLASGYPREIGERKDGRLDEFVFLAKPFRRRELIDAIENALDSGAGSRSSAG